jgi:hypothetical protein
MRIGVSSGSVRSVPLGRSERFHNTASVRPRMAQRTDGLGDSDGQTDEPKQRETHMAALPPVAEFRLIGGLARSRPVAPLPK